MAQYLSPDQRALLERELAGTATENGALTDSQKQQAINQGMEMARSDLSAPDEAGLLAQNGFDSAGQLLEAYRRAQSELNDLRGALSRLTTLSEALDNARELDPRDPAFSGLEPIYERERTDARNRVIQSEWKKRASEMDDIQQFLPEMAEYILSHPAYALESDGLERAYDAVRSGKYKSESDLLSDPATVRRLAQDERVKNAVLTAHMAQIHRVGRDVPACIADGGNTPAADGHNSGGMERAKARLIAMLASD